MDDPVTIDWTSSETFAFAQDVTDWGPLYNLASGIFRAQMRDPVNDSIVFNEWASTNGGILYSEAAAYGSIQFTAAPVAGTYLQVGTQIVTFVASDATGLEVNISTLAATLIALLALLQASTDPQLSLCSYALSGSSLQLTAEAAGWQGNNIDLATNVAGATASGTTLSGGAHTVTLLSPLVISKVFDGTYIYDCRFEFGTTQTAILFGGPMVWTQGVTRLSTDGAVTPNTVASAVDLAWQPSMLASLVFG